jgi:hypothetical protein
MQTNSLDQLTRGRGKLNALFESAGFSWSPGGEGHSSGGTFASGAYVRGDRRLELHSR